MAESTLSISYTELMLAVGVFLGYGADSTAWTAGQTAEIDRYVQAGVRRVYFPPAAEGIEEGYAWSFLQPTDTITTAIDDSDQDMPDDFGRLVGELTFDPEQHVSPVVLVSVGQMLELRQQTTSTGRPQYAAIRFKDGSTTTGQRSEILWWPTPDAAYVMNYHYEAYTGKLSAANLYPLGGMRHSELYTESCLAVAEKQANDEIGLHQQEFIRMLAASIRMDRKNGARFYGQMGGGEDFVLPRRSPLASYPLTYKGDSW